MKLDEYCGNFETVKALNNYFDSFFHQNTKTYPYVILYGTSGNGKTFLVEAFAEAYNVDLLKFTEDDFDNPDIVEKSINLQSIESQKSKIVLFDNIEEIKKKSRLYKMYETSNYPVVYIIDSIANIDNIEFKSKGLVLKISKPLQHELVNFLINKSKELNITCNIINEIAKESFSIRTALQALQFNKIPYKATTYSNTYKMVLLMSKRKLEEDVSWYHMFNAFKSLEKIDKVTYNIMKQFSKLDYIVHVEHFKDKSILLNKIIFNNMPNIELVKPFFEEKINNYKNKNQKKEKKEKKKVVIIDTHNNIMDLM